MLQEASFADLMDRLRQGDDSAAAQLFQRFGQRLVGLAANRLNGVVRSKLDAEDVAQSAWKSFFARQEEFDLNGWDSLWSLLTVLTLRKCGYRVRHFRTEARDVRREVAALQAADGSAAGWEVVAREPTPAEAVALAETVEQLFRGLDERDRQIVELRLQGFQSSEIGAQVGCTRRTVHRVLELVQRKLERLSGEVTDAP
jgi:RNA polymerase sigma-70 factor (ECF subfamily)